MKKLILYLLFFINLSLFAKSPLLIYYGDNASLSYLSHFKNLVLDPDNYMNVFNVEGTKYGYLSIGEISKNRWYFNYVKNWGILKKEDPYLNGSYFIDLKSGMWQDFVLNFLIPKILSKGYDGIFLDTVDALILNEKNINLIINFINSIKKRFPNIKVMMNRGFEILNKVNVDAVLFESTITTYDFKKKKFYFLKEKIKIKLKKKADIFSIDYWNLSDIKTIKKIYKIALKRGYKPFVTDISLYKLPNFLYDEDKKTFYTISNLNSH